MPRVRHRKANVLAVIGAGSELGQNVLEVGRRAPEPPDAVHQRRIA